MEHDDSPIDSVAPRSPVGAGPLRLWYPDDLTTALDLPPAARAARNSDDNDDGDGYGTHDHRGADDIDGERADDGDGTRDEGGHGDGDPVVESTAAQARSAPASPPAVLVTHSVVGPGLRFASESLDFLLLASLAVMASSVVTLPWVAPAHAPGSLATLADSLATAVAGTPAGPAAVAAAREFAIRTLQAWVQLVMAAFLFLPLMLAAVGLDRTPGMLLLGVRPVFLDTGARPPVTALVVRAMGRMLDALPLFFLGGLFASTRDPLGARRFLGEQMSRTALVRTISISDELAALGVPATAYGTQEAGYLVEALLARLPNLSPERGHALARRLTEIIVRHHSDAITPELRSMVDRNEPIQFLRELLRTTRES